MPIRTDVSEDAKGDPTKLIPQQPTPGQEDRDREPVIPKPDGPKSDPKAKKPAQTVTDRRGEDAQSDEDGS